MGWLWKSEPKPSTSGDPYSNLDPALREFLDKESTLKPTPPPRQPSTTPSPDAASNTYRSQLGWTNPSLDSNTQNALPSPISQQPPVPAESLYQDGRYAHLWKDYRPQAEIEAASQSDQDKLAAVIDAYNDRKAAIGRAAVENCVMEQMAERDCWENGSWADRMSMCRGPNRDFMRCYTMQSRFLKALGYLSSMRSEEEEERIQMHADKLFHEMIEREQEAEVARKEGREVPTMPPLIEAGSTAKALGEESAWAKARQKALEMGESGRLSAYTPERQEKIKKQIEGLNEREKELELQLIAAESRAQLEYAEKIREQLDVERQHRLERRERGKETVGDTIKRLWGWDR